MAMRVIGINQVIDLIKDKCKFCSFWNIKGCFWTLQTIGMNQVIDLIINLMHSDLIQCFLQQLFQFMNWGTYRNKLCHDLIKKQTYIYVFSTLEDVIKL